MKYVAGILLLVCVCLQGYGQNQVNTPYSRFGIGELIYPSNASSFTLGRTYSTYYDTTEVNFGNPASYSFISYQRPTFDVGIGGTSTEFNTSTDTDYGRASGLRNLVFGIPISKKWGGAFGLMPFSGVGYGITSTQQLEDSSDVDFIYSGAGGMNRIFAGVSYAPLLTDNHALSFGINGSYVFGNLTKTRKIEFQNQTYINTQVQSEARVRDFLLDAGFMYRGKVSDNVRVLLGGTYGIPTNMEASRTELATSYYIVSATGLVGTIDTLENIDDSQGHIRIPKRFSYGLGFEILTGKTDESDITFGKLTLNAQYSQTDWSDYEEIFDGNSISDSLKNSSTWAFGIQFQPLTTRLAEGNSYFRLMKYRLGLRYNKSFLNFDDERIDNYGMSFGVGFPLTNTGSNSSVNIGFDLGKRGTTENNLIEEKYFGFFVGFSLTPNQYNKWFVKRKYD